MKKICVLLTGPVRHDSRVIKTVNTLSKQALVDLYYVDATNEDAELFGDNVSLCPMPQSDGLRAKLLRHTLFYREYDFFVARVLESKHKYDFVYANDLPTLLPAIHLKRRWKAKLIYDSHEIYIETLNQFFPTHTSAFKALVFKFALKTMRGAGQIAERRMLHEVDTFITVNQSLAGYFCEIYGQRSITVVMNCPAHRNVVLSTGTDYRKLFGWTDSDTIFIYQGVINRGRGYESLLQAMTKVEPKIKLVIVGDGMLRKELSEFVKHSQLEERVKFIGQVSPEQLTNYTLGADVGINFVGLEAFNLSKKLASPNKLFEYMHAGLPILASDTPENRHVLQKYDAGMLVRNDLIEIVKGLTKFAHLDAEMISYYKKNSLRGADEYSWENQSQQLLNAVGHTTNSKRV